MGRVGLLSAGSLDQKGFDWIPRCKTGLALLDVKDKSERSNE
jgi:hypothetical protein